MGSTVNRQRLLDRFLSYVQIDSTARPDVDKYPSSTGQLELGRAVCRDLLAVGVNDVVQDEHGVVMATLPATAGDGRPTIAFCAHLDTSPEMPGAGVRPQVIENYGGGDLHLPGDADQVITVASNPELAALHGCTLITSDGTTLLGADDKTGVAVIIEALAHLIDNPHIPHGPIRAVFTCDEEIGRGVDKLDLDRIGATVCYTFDGHGADEIDVETFSADAAVVAVRGVNVHPSIAKGRMVNAIRAAGIFIEQLPGDHLAPEVTDGREGFLHPHDIRGRVGEVTLQLLLRDFDTPRLAEYAQLLHRIARLTEQRVPGVSVQVETKPQYRNMADGLAAEPRAVGYAEEALARLGRQPRRTTVRGGTDGSRLTELGLPTPNLSSGQHTPHSVLEWACLEEMVVAVDWAVAIAERWAECS